MLRKLSCIFPKGHFKICEVPSVLNFGLRVQRCVPCGSCQTSRPIMKHLPLCGVECDLFLNGHSYEEKSVRSTKATIKFSLMRSLHKKYLYHVLLDIICKTPIYKNYINKIHHFSFKICMILSQNC